jgi:N-acetyl sugar amidotransferase
MDTSDPLITFDDAGQCNHCTEFIDRRMKHNYRGEESDRQLLALVEEMKAAGKGKEYDCVIGMSGGIDSSYVGWLTRKHGLRVLAVHLDNGWNAEEAVLNIRNITGKLGIDYESYVLDWEEFRDIQLAFLKASIPEAETPTDMAIPAALHKVAADIGIKYVVSGGNFATEGILPKSWHYNAKDLRYFKHITRKFGSVRVRKFPTFGFLKEFYYKIFKRMKIIYLLNYTPYAKDEAIHLLETELDWKYYGGKHYESRYTGFIQSYYLYTKFGIDYRRATYSTQICTGEMKREEAIEMLKTQPFNEERVLREKEYIAKKLKITPEEFERILQLPPKWYWDYPNQEKWLGFVYNTYRRIFKKEKLASF